MSCLLLLPAHAAVLVYSNARANLESVQPADSAMLSYIKTKRWIGSVLLITLVTLSLPIAQGSVTNTDITLQERSVMRNIVGTRVQLLAPVEFETTPMFAGLQYAKDNVAIVVNEIPSSYIEFSRLYSDASLAGTDMTLESRKAIEKDGLSGQLIKVGQKMGNKPFERWILITGDTKESVMIAGYYPKRLAGKYAKTIKHSLETAFWDSATVLDHFSGLGYRVDDVPSLRVATRMSNNIIFTKNGRLPDQFYTDALLMMSLKHAPKKMQLEEEFAIRQFNQISLLENHQITKTISRQISGSDTVTVEGVGRHKHLGYSVAVMQVIINTEAGFLTAQGFTKIENQENDFDVFRTTIGSFRIESP